MRHQPPSSSARSTHRGETQVARAWRHRRRRIEAHAVVAHQHHDAVAGAQRAYLHVLAFACLRAFAIASSAMR